MSEHIVVTCPCGKKLKAPSEMLGEKARCSECGELLTVEVAGDQSVAPTPAPAAPESAAPSTPPSPTTGLADARRLPVSPPTASAATQVIPIYQHTSLAVAAMVLGICAFFMPIWGLAASIVAIILGAKALGKIKRGMMGGKGYAMAGLICGIISVLIQCAVTAAIVVPMFSGTPQSVLQNIDASNKKTIQAALERYRFDTGTYPPNLQTLADQDYLDEVPTRAADDKPFRYVLRSDGDDYTVD